MVPQITHKTLSKGGWNIELFVISFLALKNIPISFWCGTVESLTLNYLYTMSIILFNITLLLRARASCPYTQPHPLFVRLSKLKPFTHSEIYSGNIFHFEGSE